MGGRCLWCGRLAQKRSSHFKITEMIAGCSIVRSRNIAYIVVPSSSLSQTSHTIDGESSSTYSSKTRSEMHQSLTSIDSQSCTWLAANLPLNLLCYMLSSILILMKLVIEVVMLLMLSICNFKLGRCAGNLSKCIWDVDWLIQCQLNVWNVFVCI